MNPVQNETANFIHKPPALIKLTPMNYVLAATAEPFQVSRAEPLAHEWRTQADDHRPTDGNHQEVGLTLKLVSCIRDPINFVSNKGGNNGRNQ